METHRHPIHVISANPMATIVEAAERRINDKLICLKSTLPTPHAVARPVSTECGAYLSTHTHSIRSTELNLGPDRTPGTREFHFTITHANSDRRYSVYTRIVTNEGSNLFVLLKLTFFLNFESFILTFIRKSLLSFN